MGDYMTIGDLMAECEDMDSADAEPRINAWIESRSTLLARDGKTLTDAITTALREARPMLAKHMIEVNVRGTDRDREISGFSDGHDLTVNSNPC